MDLTLNTNEQIEVTARMPVTAKVTKGTATATPKREGNGLIVRAGKAVGVTVFEVSGGSANTKLFLNVVDGARRPVGFASADGSALGLTAGMPVNDSAPVASAPAPAPKPGPAAPGAPAPSSEPPAGTPVSGPGSDPEHQLAGGDGQRSPKRSN